MFVDRINGTTRVLGKSQGYIGLPVRDEVTPDGVSLMITSWQLTPKELEALNAGASVRVTIMGTEHPPIKLDVSEPPV